MALYMHQCRFSSFHCEAPSSGKLCLWMLEEDKYSVKEKSNEVVLGHIMQHFVTVSMPYVFVC